MLEDGTASVVVNASESQRFFRIRYADAGPLAVIAGTSPAQGESGVAVTRETIFRFSSPLSPGVSFNPAALFAEAQGRRLLSRSEVSSDREKISLFYLEPLPGSTRVRVTLDGSGISSVDGAPLDADSDGAPGGTAVLEFETSSTTAVPETAIIGRVFASELQPGPGGTTGSLNRPLQGVTVTVDGAEETLRAVTDENGNFRLFPAPSGTFFVHIDGRTSPESDWPGGAYYPFVGKSWTAVGAPGTIYVRQGDEPGMVVVRGGGRETPLPELAGGETILINGTRVSALLVEALELHLENGAVLTHPAAMPDSESRLEIRATRILIDTNSSIQVDGRGYLGAHRGGNNRNTGRTVGNAEGSTRRNGGSYGGLGAWGSTERTVNSVYGDCRDPDELGSGGGSDSGLAGNGGGLVQIEAEQLMVEGEISAEGGEGSHFGGRRQRRGDSNQHSQPVGKRFHHGQRRERGRPIRRRRRRPHRDRDGDDQPTVEH